MTQPRTYSVSATPLLSGRTFVEAPRWYRNRLWFSDIFGHEVLASDEDGQAAVVVRFGPEVLPSGLGFLPDGRLLVVDLASPRLLRIDGPDQIAVHADLSALAIGPVNDMVVDSTGRAYVGSAGLDPIAAPRPLDGTGVIIRVDPDGSARIVADRLDAPNGAVLSADGRRYVVAELPAHRLTAFEVTDNGDLVGRHEFADLSPFSADGIAIDSEGAVWTASPDDAVCRRVIEGGQVTDIVTVPGRRPAACCIGGSNGRTLFVLSNRSNEVALRWLRRRDGVVEDGVVEDGSEPSDLSDNGRIDAVGVSVAA